MRAFLLAGLTLLLAFTAADCSGDNCANHVTGSWGGIGVPVKSRISMCNDHLRATIQPQTKTVTTTIHKYTTKLPQTTTATTTVTTSRIRGNTSASATPGLNQTIVYGPVPAFATAQCPEAGQFASACRCWASVSTRTMAVSASTVTTTTTAWHNVGCGPAATAVGSKSSFFPCSRQWGTCSCLKSGVQDICVRIGPFLGEGRNMTGPCADFDECDAEGGCKDGFACVYDGSCKCGKRRCYKAAPNGCDYQGLPIDDFKKRL